jgi:hypothetical protein
LKYLDEFRDPDLAQRLLEEIHAVTTRHWALMEVCGGQTHSIIRNGIDQLLRDLYWLDAVRLEKAPAGTAVDAAALATPQPPEEVIRTGNLVGTVTAGPAMQPLPTTLTLQFVAVATGLVSEHTVTTDATGTYVVEDLLAGDYILTLLPPPEYLPTAPMPLTVLGGQPTSVSHTVTLEPAGDTQRIYLPLVAQ